MLEAIQTAWRKLLFLSRRTPFEQGLEEEMLLYLERRTRQLQEDGTNAVDAERIAWHDFGNLSLLRETSREVWSWRWIESIWQDLCFGARQLARQPGFALIAILTLALGIGANCAIFSLLNAVLIRQVPVHRPQDLVWFGSARATGSTVDFPDGGVTLFSYPFFREFRRETKAFSDVAAVFSQPFGTHGRIGSASGMERVTVELVSRTYFATLGLDPIQ